MKTKLFLYLALIVALLGCSFFENLARSTSEPEGQPSENNPVAENEEISMEGWLLPDPAAGLASLESYHQQLTISFQGTRDGADYEWVNAYRRDVWAKDSADFLTLATSGTGEEPYERLDGKVGQAYYSRVGAGATCQVSWREAAPDEKAESILEPASFLPAIDQAAEAGTETVNDVPAHHYTLKEGQVTGDLWLAEPGGFVVRYVLTLSGGEEMFGEGLEGEQRFEYELTRVNVPGAVVYPEGCAAVLVDFPIMDGARNLHRWPEAVDYTISAETEAISQFYQDQLPAQGWTFVSAHDKDPKNVILVFVHKDQGKAASILLSARDKGVWVSAMLRPWESASGAQ